MDDGVKSKETQNLDKNKNKINGIHVDRSVQKQQNTHGNGMTNSVTPLNGTNIEIQVQL